MDENPWQVESLQDFSYLKCPECSFDAKEEEVFEYHATENHPLSFVFFGKIFVKEEALEMDEYNLVSENIIGTPNFPKITNIKKEFADDDNDKEEKEKPRPQENKLEANGEAVKCQYCEYSSPWKGVVRKHEFTIHKVSGPKQNKCSHCDFFFEKESNLKRHIRKVHEQKREHFCSECDGSFLDIRLLKAHIATVHEGKNHHKCKICNITLSTEVILKRHIKTVHEKVRPHKCPKCDYAASIKAHIKKHLFRIHNVSLEDIHSILFEKENIKCCYCDNNFSMEVDYQTHVKLVHEGMKPYKCTLCDLSFNMKAHRKTHLERIHEKKKSYLCDDCGYGALNRSELKRHVDTIHKGLKPHICSICGVGFGIKNDLKTHIKRHTGNKDHLCHYCDYKSVDSSSLSQHIKMVHEKERPFVCSTCGSSFGTKQKLKIHMNRHTGTKTHLCKYCDFKAVESSGLNRHIRAVHEKEKPVCLSNMQ